MLRVKLTFKEILRRYFAKKIYPTYKGDWYKRKGYQGESDSARFNDFLAKQRLPDAIYYKEFNSLILTRNFIDSDNFKLDTVWIRPENTDKNKLWIVCFYGRGEYYEGRFRDMAIMAKELQANVIGFNPKGFHNSTGKTRILSDIVCDGIAITESLIAQGITPKQIVFYGNSLGGGVQAMVSQYFTNLKGIRFRQINSNSFRSIAAVFAFNLYIPFLEKTLSALMRYAGWEIDYNQDFHKTGIYRCYLVREGDQTIKQKASFAASIDSQQDTNDAPQRYKTTLKWLNDNAMLIANTKKDPHDLSLNQLYLKSQDQDGQHFSVWYFIKKYLETSDKFL